MLNFGERLIQIREERDVSRKELAEQLGIPYTTLRNYETGKREPGHKTLIQLSRIFNVSCDYLLGVETPAKDIAPLQQELIAATEGMAEDDLRALIAIARRLCDS